MSSTNLNTCNDTLTNESTDDDYTLLSTPIVTSNHPAIDIQLYAKWKYDGLLKMKVCQSSTIMSIHFVYVNCFAFSLSDF